MSGSPRDGLAGWAAAHTHTSSEAFCVVYAAKSTADAHGSLEQQRKDCLEFAEREGLTVAGHFADEGYSGFSGNRGPDLERALALASDIAAEAGVCHLICVHTDRLSRGAGDAPGAPRHLLEILFAATRAGVRLRSGLLDAGCGMAASDEQFVAVDAMRLEGTRSWCNWCRVLTSEALLPRAIPFVIRGVQPSP